MVGLSIHRWYARCEASVLFRKQLSDSNWNDTELGDWKREMRLIRETDISIQGLAIAFIGNVLKILVGIIWGQQKTLMTNM